MAFSSAARSVKLYFESDTKGLERGLARSEAKLKKFERVAGRQSTLNSGLLGGLGKAGVVTAGLGAAAVGLRSVIKAAEDAQAVQAKLTVSTENAGISYAQYAKRINKAIQAESQLTGLDDERLSETFSNLIRTTKDVGQALRLMSTAADLARTKGISLEAASSLLARAYNGNFRGLNRLGLAITPVTAAQDRLRASTKNATEDQKRAAKATDSLATKQQALALIQSTFAGQAAAYGKTAVGANERLGVSIENLQESLGGALLPTLTKVVNSLNDVATAGGHVGDGLKQADKKSDGFLSGALGHLVKFSMLANPEGQIVLGARAINDAFSDTKSLLADINLLASGFAATISGVGSINLNPAGNPAVGAQIAGGKASSNGIDPGVGKGGKLGKANGANLNLPVSLQNEEADARLGGNRNRIKGVLAKEAAYLQQQILNSIGKDQVAYKNALLGVTSEIKSIDDSIIQDAKDKQQAIKDAKDAQIAAHKKALAALKAQARAFKDQASAIKSAVLDAFDTKTSKIDNARALADAKKELHTARLIGTPEGLLRANRDVTDANRAIQRQKIADTPFRVTDGPRGPVDRLSVGTQIFYINGENADVIAKKVAAIFNKKSKQTASQTRGRVPGRGTF